MKFVKFAEPLRTRKLDRSNKKRRTKLISYLINLVRGYYIYSELRELRTNSKEAQFDLLLERWCSHG